MRRKLTVLGITLAMAAAFAGCSADAVKDTKPAEAVTVEETKEKQEDKTVETTTEAPATEAPATEAPSTEAQKEETKNAEVAKSETKDAKEVKTEAKADTPKQEKKSEETASEEKSDDEAEKAEPAEEEKVSDKEETSEEEKPDDSEAKAGVEALAALFGEEINHSNDSDDDSAEDKEESEDKSDDEKAEDSDEAVKESTPEPAHAAMRPGTIALNSVKFGEDEPEDDGNVLIQSSNEVVEVVEADELISKEDLNPSELKHEPVKTKKEKGIPLAAWIALELAGCILAIALMVPLTATGISEWATYFNLNKGYTSVNINSPVTKWIMENTDPSDVFLTPTWSMNRFILAGRPMYYGWPYYAWSAGHDTYTRDTIYQWLISGCDNDIEEFTRYCKERHIRYLIADGDMYDAQFDSGITFNREFVEKNLTHAAYFAEEDTTIYRIY